MNEPLGRPVKYATVFRPEAREELRKIDRGQALRILSKLAELEANPYGLGTTQLVGQPDRRRLRVGNYRVIYAVDGAVPVIWAVWVGHRSEAR
jgi:mRNA interferase RelE/StbE